MMNKKQKNELRYSKATPEGNGRNPERYGLGASNITATKEQLLPDMSKLMEIVVENKNVSLALKRVEKNKGSAGVDNMPVEALRSYLREHWPKLKDELLKGTYKPKAVRKVEIPKPGNKGTRILGIPTVLDRFIQQAIHQVLSPIFDLTFSESSFGFRPHRSAHMAIKKSQGYVAQGERWVVDIDLEKFFDRVNHDILMSRVARRIKDKRLLLLIRRYLQSGCMEGGLATMQRQGTPQGGPLSPLLSNIILDDLDKELERRGHSHSRYADDCNIYVSSKKSGDRVLESITRFLERKLKLKVNQDKSKVGRPWKIKFLGYSMTMNMKPLLKVAPESWERLRGNLKQIFRKGRCRNLGRFITEDLNPVLKGWVYYFSMSQTKPTFQEQDAWIRRRLRSLLWRQWKRFKTRKKKLMARGIEAKRFCNGRGPWWNAGSSHMNEAYPKSYFESLGLVSLFTELQRIQLTKRTAVYGTVRTVV